MEHSENDPIFYIFLVNFAHECIINAFCQWMTQFNDIFWLHKGRVGNILDRYNILRNAVKN